MRKDFLICKIFYAFHFSIIDFLLQTQFGALLLKLVACLTKRRLNNLSLNKKLAYSSYRAGLQEATADATVWQYAGKESAHVYARMREDLMLSICMKKVWNNN